MFQVKTADFFIYFIFSILNFLHIQTLLFNISKGKLAHCLSTKHMTYDISH